MVSNMVQLVTFGLDAIIQTDVDDFILSYTFDQLIWKLC